MHEFKTLLLCVLCKHLESQHGMFLYFAVPINNVGERSLSEVLGTVMYSQLFALAQCSCTSDSPDNFRQVRFVIFFGLLW